MYDDLEYLNLKLIQAMNHRNPNIVTMWRLMNQITILEDTIHMYESERDFSYKTVNDFSGIKLLKKHRL